MKKKISLVQCRALWANLAQRIQRMDLVAARPRVEASPASMPNAQCNRVSYLEEIARLDKIIAKFESQLLPQRQDCC